MKIIPRQSVEKKTPLYIPFCFDFMYITSDWNIKKYLRLCESTQPGNIFRKIHNQGRKRQFKILTEGSENGPAVAAAKQM